MIKEKIAVIGFSNVFPGSTTPDDFWQGLLNKQQGKSDVTCDDMQADPEAYRGNEGDIDKFYCLKGGYIRDFSFESQGFLLPAEQLAALDDLFQLSLTVSRSALKHAGYWQGQPLDDCGVLLGNLSFPTRSSNHLYLPLYRTAYESALQQAELAFGVVPFAPEQPVVRENGLIAGYPSAVIAQACGLGGSHFSLDAACASSCYSVQLACHYLQTGKANMMLAGAVSAADPMFIHMGFSIFHAYPANQVHAPFDQDSEGLFAGEGAGMLVLKRLSDAQKDGDTIHAVIEGGGLSNDGKGEFVLSPNKKGQVLAYARAYQDAELPPATVDYVECHATGTPKGDKVELSSMQDFFQSHDTKPLIGSVKSNLGHLLTAAGMPGMIKSIYALKTRKIPATVNINHPIQSPDGYFSATEIVTEITDWPLENHPATAAVSVFGFGGSNAHLVFREASDTVTSTHTLNVQEPMVIVGMDAYFGVASSLSAFQSLIVENQSNFTSLPEKRWKGFEKIPEMLAPLGIQQPPKGGFIDTFDMDFLHFKIPPNDDDSLIPQQLLMMKVADNAAQRADLKQGQNVAVLVAMGIEPELHQYRGRVNMATQVEASLQQQGIQLTDDEKQQFTDSLKGSLADSAGLNQYTSFIGNIMASRISSLWDFSGPALTVSAEENSVFRAIELADTLFQTTDVDAVIIAAVDLAGSYENIFLRAQFLPLAQSVSSTLDEQEGFFAGEGAGAFVLKPASRAQGMVAIDGLGFAQGINGESSQKAAGKALGVLAPAQIDGIDISLACTKTANGEEIALFNHLYPNAKIFCSKQQVGHTFNAQGMTQILASAARIQAGQAKYMAINTQGTDGITSHIVLSKGSDHYQEKSITSESRLVKSIQVGGDDLVKTFSEKLPKAIKHRLKQLLPDVQTETSPLPETNVISETKATKVPKPHDKPLSTSSTSEVFPLFEKLKQQQIKTHQTFLTIRLDAQRQISQALTGGIRENTLVGGTTPRNTTVTFSSPASTGDLVLTERFTQPKQVIFDQAALVEFAEGDIGNVFGEEYRVIDQYSRRVRLPTSDYLLVTRVTDLDATVNEYKPSYMATEYDIPVDAPFLVDGQIPWSVSVESGQCDLMLISYIGIDFKSKGERVYRLLDCELTFLEDIAFGGQTLRYEIHIDSYARNGEQLLFFFHYDCYVEGKKVLIMRGGCAGFFTDEELSEGKGVIHTEEDKAELANAQKQTFTPFIANTKTQYSYQDMMKLVQGDISGCFGANYDQGAKNPSLKFSSEKFLMIEEVQSIDPTGGHWGLGVLIGRKRLEPHHWYFPCHFKDDPVMAGSLMSEGCGQLAMFFMLWLGMHKDMRNARFQPVHGASQKVRCRGQVTPQSNDLFYRLEVTKISMTPNPIIHANIDIILDGKVVVDFKNLAVQIKEQAEDSPYARQLVGLNVDEKASHTPLAVNESVQKDETGKQPFKNLQAPLMWVETDGAAPMVKGVKPIKHVEAPIAAGQNNTPDSLPFTPWHLFEFATGDIAKCFGDEYAVYHGRIPPRTPCGDLQLVTEVVAVEGKRHDLKKPSSCLAHYQVPDDAWYFSKNTYPDYMPYSVMMEIALQPNGFISGYMGTTLVYPEKDLFFRNLDGTGELIKDIDLRGKTIVNDSKMLSTSMAGGSIIQSFSFDLSADGETFYRGTAVFGYFSNEALTNQLGIDNGELTQPWFANKSGFDKKIIDLQDQSQPFYQVSASQPHYRLCQGQLNFLDQVTVVKEGGEFGKGYLLGERTIDPSDWFFRYHFHQDPVMPGSLGVEAMVELLKVFALEQDLGAEFKNPRFVAPLTTVKWKYRGQITPTNRTMSVDVHIKSVERIDGQVVILGDANLSKDNLRIYQVFDIALAIEEAD